MHKVSYGEEQEGVRKPAHSHNVCKIREGPGYREPVARSRISLRVAESVLYNATSEQGLACTRRGSGLRLTRPLDKHSWPCHCHERHSGLLPMPLPANVPAHLASALGIRPETWLRQPRNPVSSALTSLFVLPGPPSTEQFCDPEPGGRIAEALRLRHQSR